MVKLKPLMPNIKELSVSYIIPDSLILLNSVKPELEVIVV